MEQPRSGSDTGRIGNNSVTEQNASNVLNIHRNTPTLGHTQGKTGRVMMVRGGLSVNGGLNFGIPSKQGAQDYVEQYHGKQSWRMKIMEFLHEPRVSMFLMGLLLLDVIILFVELFLLTHYPSCLIIERDCISCCAPESATNETDHNAERFLSVGVDEHHAEVCDAGLEPSYETGACDAHKWETIHNVELGLFSVTVTILSIFFLELTMEMIALRPTVFFRQFFYALDYVIVTVSLVLELSLHFVEEDSLAALLGVLIFARIWRFVRIGHGIIEVTSEYTHQKYDMLLEYTRALEEAAIKSNAEIPDCPEEVRKALTEQISSHHSSG
jgi:hypothetical protein